MSAVPEMRFPEFEGEWLEVTLGDFMTFRNGINADKSQYGRGTKFVNVLDIISGRPITYENIIGSVDVSDTIREKNAVLFGDILFQRSSETRDEAGQSNVYIDPERPALFGGFVIRGRPTGNIDPIYLDGVLKTSKVRKEVTDRSAGSTRFNVGQDSLSSVPVHVAPTLPEQQKIAAFIGAVDNKIDALRRKHASLKQFKTGLMQKLFSQELRFKRDDGSEFPDWEEKRLSVLASRPRIKNDGIEISRVLTNSAIGGIVDQGEYFDKDIANAENLAGYYVVEVGDFVYNPRISSSAPVGPLHRNDLGRGVMSPLYTVFRFDDKDTDFYRHYFHSHFWHRYMKSVANYGARHDRMAITNADFMAMPLPVPHEDERRKVADCLSAADAKIDAVEGQITQMEAFKKGLLQKMFV